MIRRAIGCRCGRPGLAVLAMASVLGALPSTAEEVPVEALRADARRVAEALAGLPPDQSLARFGTLLRLGTLQRILGDPDGARDTLRRAADEAGRIVKHAPLNDEPFEPSGRVTPLATAARALARAGDIEAAREVVARSVRTLEDHPPVAGRDLVSLLGRLAPAQAAVGDSAATLATRARMLAVLEADPDPTRFTMWLQMIDAAARSGDFDGALGLALAPPADLGDAYERRLREGESAGIEQLVRAIQPESGDEGRRALDRVLRLPLMTVQDGVFVEHPNRRVLQIELALAQARMGDTAGALATIDTLDDDGDKALCMIDVAEAQIAAKEHAEARGTLDEARGRALRAASEDDRRRALSRIAPLLVEADDVDGAQETLRLIDASQTHIRMWVLTRAARARERAGDAAGSQALLEMARALADERNRQPLARPGLARDAEDFGRYDIASIEARLGRFEEALRWLGDIRAAQPREQGHRAVAAIQAEYGDIADVLAWIAGKPPEVRFWALTGAVEGLARRAGAYREVMRVSRG